MLTVTRRARVKLRQTLREATTDPDKAIRLVLVPSPFMPFGFVVDGQEEGDQVVESDDGSKVLIVGPAVGAALADSIMDYCETHTGSAFTLSRVGPVN
jgi:Fe-S cluster assembly iron-binding protein IscA